MAMSMGLAGMPNMTNKITKKVSWPGGQVARWPGGFHSRSQAPKQFVQASELGI